MDFCLGISGTIPMLSRAHELFYDDPDLKKRLLIVADDVGKKIWEQGLVCKSKGVCHGIAGNGYLLHSLA